MTPFVFLIRKTRLKSADFQRVVQAECMYHFGTGRVPVPCVTDTWCRHAVSTKPVTLGQEKVKRHLSPVPGTDHIPTLEPYFFFWVFCRHIN